jgi:uncharacterized protein (TIGR00106 family)
MLADFAVVPMGVTGRVKELVAEALRIVDESGLSDKLGAMHTTIEGDSDRVMDVILRCHRRMLELAPRVLTTSPSTIAEAQPAVLKARSEMWNRYSASRSHVSENNVYHGR